MKGVVLSCMFLLQINSIIVFGVVVDKMEENVGDQRLCYFDNAGHTQACDTAVAVGVLSMILSMLYSFIHFVEARQMRTYSIVSTQGLLITRMCVAGLMAFMWLVSFGVMAHDWSTSNFNNPNSSFGGPARAAQGFAFICLLAWVSSEL